MNRLILKYFLYFVVLGAFLIFLLRERTPFGSGNTSFAVDPDAKISRIDFFQGDKKLSLEKSGEKWLINKKDEARKSAVLFILRTLSEIKIKSPVSKEIFDTLFDTLLITSIIEFTVLTLFNSSMQEILYE